MSSSHTQNPSHKTSTPTPFKKPHNNTIKTIPFSIAIAKLNEYGKPNQMQRLIDELNLSDFLWRPFPISHHSISNETLSPPSAVPAKPIAMTPEDVSDVNLNNEVYNNITFETAILWWNLELYNIVNDTDRATKVREWLSKKGLELDSHQFPSYTSRKIKKSLL